MSRQKVRPVKVFQKISCTDCQLSAVSAERGPKGSALSAIGEGPQACVVADTSRALLVQAHHHHVYGCVIISEDRCIALDARKPFGINHVGGVAGNGCDRDFFFVH